MIHVGLTGGIGSGKTLALRVFGSFGARTLDADSVVHGLYAPGSEMCGYLRDRWGSAVLSSDGSVNRVAVSRIVFASQRELSWLGSLIHPLVREIFLAEASRPGPPLFCAVPLLHEAGWSGDFGLVASLWCDHRTQWDRLRSRGWSAGQIRQRTARQLSMDEKLLRSDIGLMNTGSIDLLARQCRHLYKMVSDGRFQPTWKDKEDDRRFRREERGCG